MDAANTLDQSRQHDGSLEELVEEIDLHERMLRDLDGQSFEDSAEQRGVINDILKELRARLQKIQSQFPWDYMEDTEDDDFLASFGPKTPSPDEPFDNDHMQHQDTGGSSRTPRPNSSSGSQKSSRFSEYSNCESPFLTLPNHSRKRPLDCENEAYARSGREIKSRRTTPSPAVTAPTTPSSASDSCDFGFGDDPILQKLLGGDLKDQMRDSRKYEKELEQKREQEKADEEFARMLSEQYNPPQASFSKPTNLYQSTFDPVSGTIYRSMPPPPRPTIKLESIKTEQKAYLPFAGSSSSTPGAFPVKEMPSPVSMPDSDSDLEEISREDFTLRRTTSGPTEGNPFGAMNPGYPAASTFSRMMPGGYPAAFTGVGGSSVYNPGAYNPYASTPIGGNLDVLSAGQDSLALPFDPTDHLSSLRDYRDSLYNDPAKTEEEIKELLAHIRPDEDIDANSREGTPPQMKLTLMEHQKLGLAWMKKMEEGSNKGGKSAKFSSLLDTTCSTPERIFDGILA
jgi:hypothetical protein